MAKFTFWNFYIKTSYVNFAFACNFKHMPEMSIYCNIPLYHHLSRIYTSKNDKNAHTALVLISINDKNSLSLVVGIKKQVKVLQDTVFAF